MNWAKVEKSQASPHSWQSRSGRGGRGIHLFSDGLDPGFGRVTFQETSYETINFYQNFQLYKSGQKQYTLLP